MYEEKAEKLAKELEKSRDPENNNEHNHQWLDENGWEYRTAYVEDIKGNIYSVMLNIAKARDGRNILYDFNNIRRVGNGVVPSNAKSKRGSHINPNSSGSIVPQSEEDVKHSVSDREYLSTVKRGDVKEAQRMVDEAAARRAIESERNADRLLKLAEAIRKIAARVKQYIKDFAEGRRKRFAADGLDVGPIARETFLNDAEALMKLADMFSAAAEKARENIESYGEERSDEGEKYSQSDNPMQDEFEKHVDEIEKGTYNSDDFLIMGVTPKALRSIGLASIPIGIDKNHVYSIAVSKQRAIKENRYKGSMNYHNLGFQTVKEIYEKISDPLMIIAHPDFVTSGKQRNSAHKVIVFVDLSANNKQVIAPIEIDSDAKYNRKNIDINRVITYFDKDNINDLIKEAIALENLNETGFYYLNKKRTQEIIKRSGYQLPGKLDNLSSNIIIRKLGENVNRKISDVTQSRQFIRWFGDWQNKPKRASKVVDKDGKPLVVYHGTSNGGFTVFDAYGGKFGLFGNGLYFTEDKSVAESYTEKGKGKRKQVYSVYLDIKKPIDMDKPAVISAWTKAATDMDEYFDSSYFIDCKTNEDCFRALKEYCQDEEMYRYEAEEYLTDVIQYMGYDGITHIGGGRFNKRDQNRHRVWIAFEAEQVKSATDNIGTFAPNNPDIRYSVDDRAYLSAVKRGDMEAAQRMVDEAAERAFADSKVRDEDGKLLKVYHGTDADFTVFDKTKGRANMDIQGMFFSPWEIDAGGYGQNVRSFYLNITNPASESTGFRALNSHKGENYAGRKAREDLERMGYDGVNNEDEEYIAFNSNQIKSADAVTYDDAGKVIPLSQRFDSGDEDIRYSVDEGYSLKHYSDKQIFNWQNSKNIVIYENDTQLNDFVDFALQNDYGQKMYFGVIDNKLAKFILSKTGMDLSGYNLTLRASEIRKILNKSHGHDQREKLRGQRAINKEDFTNIPRVIKAPDEIRLSGKLFEGKPVIEFEKTINGKTTVVTYVSRKHHDLTVQTMFSGKKKGSLATTPSGGGSFSQTSGTLSGTASNRRVSQKGKKVNNSDDNSYSVQDEVYDYIAAEYNRENGTVDLDKLIRRNPSAAVQTLYRKALETAHRGLFKSRLKVSGVEIARIADSIFKRL